MSSNGTFDDMIGGWAAPAPPTRACSICRQLTSLEVCSECSDIICLHFFPVQRAASVIDEAVAADVLAEAEAVVAAQEADALADELQLATADELQLATDEHELAAVQGDQEDESQVSSQWYPSQLSSLSYVEGSDSSADDGGLAAVADDPETSATVISQEAHNCHEELD